MVTMVQEEAPMLLSVEQAAHLTGIGRSAFYDLVLKGVVPSLKIGRRRLVSRVALAAYIASLESGQ